MRWVQICATEDDPQRYDPEFWMGFLKRTSTQGVCLSAGGVTASDLRTAALFQLATELPAAILARTLGIHITVAVAWQRAASAVSQFWAVTCLRVTRPRRTLARICSAVAVQRNGFGLSLCTRR